MENNFIKFLMRFHRGAILDETFPKTSPSDFISKEKGKQKVFFKNSLEGNAFSNSFTNSFQWSQESSITFNDNISTKGFHHSTDGETKKINSLKPEVIVTLSPNGTQLMSASNTSDSTLFFSLSLTIFAFVGVVIFFRRCVRCPPSTANNEFTPNGETEKPPSPIHTLYNATSDGLQIPFPSCVFKEGGSTPNLPMNAELTSVASRECMTSPEMTYNRSVNTPDTPGSFGISHSNSNFSFFPYSHDISPSKVTIYVGDTPRSGSNYPSVDGHSNYLFEAEKENLRNFERDPKECHEIHMNLISSTPSLLQASRSSLAQSPSRSNLSVSSEVTYSAYDEDSGVEKA